VRRGRGIGRDEAAKNDSLSKRSTRSGRGSAAGSAFDPNSHAAAGGGSLGYNQNLYNW